MAAVDAARPEGAWPTLLRGLRLSPELRAGLGVTLLLAAVATAGSVVVPITIQQVVDRGLRRGDAVDLRLVVTLSAVALVAVVLTSVAGYAMTYRLARTTETALSALRVRAFRHIHDLSILHHATEHRGALVSRVTADVDTISRFMQWGGVVLLANVGQLLVATAVMAVYSWQLTLLVLAGFAPLTVVLRAFQRRLSDAYDLVRRRVGEMLTAIGESVGGAAVIRAYAIEERVNARIAAAVEREFQAQYRAGRLGALMFSSGELAAAAVTAATVVAGVLLGVGGELTEGRLLAFLFLVTLFVGPVQVATEVLDEAQTAIAGWRRILNVLDTTPDVADPHDGVAIPPGPVAVRFEHVRFAYPTRTPGGDGEPATVLDDVDLEIAAQRRVAVVGETGSGKTTFAKLLTRLMDPTSGRILLNGVPLRDVRFDSLRGRVVMVPQDGFLFDASVAANVAQGRPGLSRDGIALAFTELGLADWVASLLDGLDTRVGERGEALSVGERQLVALARAYVANPDLLLLDEATSAVDPATEVRLQRALEGLTHGRTAVAIAHRLSTAEAADEVIVFDRGRVVQRGPHDRLLAQPGVYARLHASWVAGSAGGAGASEPATAGT
ncbi:MAG: ABC transporter ATP-binding protein/permease [Actinomycetota bacterium]|nr:ABC transporter ATP-binding protein/permease [Actinomycetota bacterium]